MNMWLWLWQNTPTTSSLKPSIFGGNTPLFLAWPLLFLLFFCPPLMLFDLLSSAHLLGTRLHHEDHQVCQVHRARHRPPAATLLHHWTAGSALRTPARCGDQCYPGQGERLCVCCYIVQPWEAFRLFPVFASVAFFFWSVIKFAPVVSDQ